MLENAFTPVVGAGIPALVEKARQLRDSVSAKQLDEPLFTLPVKTVPYRHQVQAFNFTWARWTAGAKGTALLMEQGTGKSLVAIALAGALQERDQIEWVLTVCPNTLRGVWAAEDGEVALHGRWPDATHVLEGSRSQKTEQLESLLRNYNAPWIVTNYDQFSVDTGARSEQGKVFRAFLDSARWRPGLIILDESSYVKNIGALRTRAMALLAEAFPYRLLLNGTPITRSPLDAFGQFEVMERGCLGFGSYLAFERHYAVYEPVRVPGGRTVQVPASFRNLEDLERRMAGLSFRARAAECLDLPPVIVRNIPVTLSPAQRLAYQQLTNDMMAEVEGGFLDGRNILTRYGKLAQVVGGHAHMIDGEGRPAGVKTFTPNPKLDALLEYLDILFEDPDAKAVVFCQYVAEVRQILAKADERKWLPAAMYGELSPAQRELGRKRFDQNSACRLMVNQYQCGSKGLNLTAANTVVFYSLTFSLEDYLQAQKRVHRAGQTAEHVNEVYLIAQREGRGGVLRPTIDNLILQALREKKDLADIVTGDRARDAMAAL
jgi:SNF2 family DNA or RNA helicase